jgi:hypothetical protein
VPLKKPTRTIFLAVAGFLAAALLLPFVVNVNRFRGQIVRALEAGLGRPVQVGSVRLRLLAWPGFDLKNVSIAEDPAFGAEPFARMPELRATLRLRSLWTGRMVFSSLVFVEPSVNLARNAQGRWAIESLLGRAASSHALAAPPYLELKDARVNFKSGDFKSVFFLADVDAAIYASPGSPRLNLRLGCSPARTDRTLTDVGQLRVEGSFQPSHPAGSPRSDIRLQVNLADAYLADLQALASGRDYGIHGLLNLRATIEGEAPALRVAGTARLADLHRWDLLPPPGNPGMDFGFQAVLDGPAGRLQVTRLQAPLGQGMLEGSGVVTGLWERPRFDLGAAFSGARAGSVLAALQHFSSGLSRSARLDGLLEGEVRLRGMPLELEGFALGHGIQFRSAELPEVRAGDVRVELEGSRVSLLPATLLWQRGATLALSGAWDWRAGSGQISGAGREVSFRGVSGLFSLAGLDLPGVTRLLPEGRASLALHADFESGGQPRLSGWAQLARVPWAPLAGSPPVMVHAARLEFAAGQARVTRLVASWAGATITGGVRLPLRLPGVCRADLRADELTSGALAGALHRGQPGIFPLLGRLPGAGAPVRPPAEEAGMQPRLSIEGRISVGRLHLRRLLLEQVSGQFRFSGGRFLLDSAHAQIAGGSWSGSAALDFSSGRPTVQVEGRVRDAALAQLAALSPQLEGAASGRISGSVAASTAGWELPEIVANLSMKLRLQGKELLLQNLDFDSAAAGGPATGPGRLSSFEAEMAVDGRSVLLRKSVFWSVSSAYSASGRVGFDRVADIEVAPLPPAALSAFRLSGLLEAPTVEQVPGSRAQVSGSKPDR